MPGARTLGFSLLIAAAACTPTPGSQAPRPLKPENGPKAYIAVDYQGGLLNRSLRASFRTEQTAYVLVGHLAGDGHIRVLFPESPDESGLVRGSTYYQTSSAAAHYDALPSLFSFTMSPYRGVGAMHDSYDGAGHGYVFIIASSTPLKYGLLDDYAGWAELEMEGYTRHSDPRYAIRNFADVLAGGARYTLKFASSMTSTSYYSYAMRAWDCSVMSSLGMFANPALWSSWYMSLHGFRSAFGSCGQSSFPFFGGRPIITTVSLPPSAPTGEPAPTLDRPGRRGLGMRPDTPTRTTLTRVSPSLPQDPDRDSFDRNRTRRPAYGARRGTTFIDTRTGRESDGGSRASKARDNGSRSSSPRESRTGSASTGSSSGTKSSDRASPSSSSGTRSERPATSSPRGESRKPDQQR